MIKLKIMVDGMMCGMCEAHLNNAIREAFKVKKVKSSHKIGECTVISADPVDKDKLTVVIEAQGYGVLGFIESPYERRGIFSLFKRK